MNTAIITLFTGLVIFCSHLLEGITGFGCTVIALPFLSAVINIKTAVPIFCITGWLMAFYIVIRSYKHIQWKEFLFIALHAAVGMPLGMLLFDRLPAEGLCIILALFMISVGGRGAKKTINENKHPDPAAAPVPVKKNLFMRLILLGCGIIQGSLGSGGPLAVIYTTQALQDKTQFRATLSMLWLVMNTWRLIDWTCRGSVWNHEIGKYTLIALPFAILGILTGDCLHHKVNVFVFRLCVYAVLTISGVLMLIKNIFAAM